jgi:RNA polymerase sigma-70 factor (ECF subfamily)
VKVKPTAKARASSALLLADWFRDLHGPLRRFIGRRRNLASADLDDVAQEVFLRLLRYDRAELVEDPRAYLFRIAANVASEWSVRARERLPHAACWLDDLVDDFDALDETERRAREQEVREAVAGLAPRTREVLRLRYAEELDNEAIARRLELTRRIVRRELAHAYAELRLKLAQKEPRS